MRLTDMTVRTLPLPERGQHTYFDESLAGFGVRLSQGGTRSFILIHGPRRERETLGRYPVISLSQAREKARLILAERTLGTGRAPRILYEDAKAGFLAHCEQKNRPKTVRDYTRILNRRFALGRTPLADLRRLDITKRLDKLKDTPAEQNYAFRVIRHFLRWCVQKGYLASSPMAEMQAPSKLKKRARTLTDTELKAVWEACEAPDLPPRFATIVRLLITTGQRRGEIAGLRTSFVDGALVSLPAELVKNSVAHTFPVGSLTIDLLHSVEVDGSQNDALFFPSQHKPSRPFSGWSRAKAQLDELTGIQGWRLHDLRRTYRTNLSRLGTPPHIAERLLNHVSAQSELERTYDLHTYVPEMRAAVEKYEAWLSALCAIPQTAPLL